MSVCTYVCACVWKVFVFVFKYYAMYLDPSLVIVYVYLCVCLPVCVYVHTMMKYINRCEAIFTLIYYVAS